jgi:hypothetical protein
MCLYIAGIVWPCSCFFSLVFQAFPDLKGSASALVSSIRMLVMACAIAAAGHIYDGSFQWVGVLIFVLAFLGFVLFLGAQRESGFQVDRAEGTGAH